MWIGQIASIFLFVTLGIHAVTLSDFPQCAVSFNNSKAFLVEILTLRSKIVRVDC